MSKSYTPGLKVLDSTIVIKERKLPLSGKVLVRAGDKVDSNKIIASTPAKRIGSPEEVANVVTFLSSKEASYVNGQVIVISGGR